MNIVLQIITIFLLLAAPAYIGWKVSDYTSKCNCNACKSKKYYCTDCKDIMLHNAPNSYWFCEHQSYSIHNNRHSISCNGYDILTHVSMEYPVIFDSNYTNYIAAPGFDRMKFLAMSSKDKTIYIEKIKLLS